MSHRHAGPALEIRPSIAFYPINLSQTVLQAEILDRTRTTPYVGRRLGAAAVHEEEKIPLHRAHTHTHGGKFWGKFRDIHNKMGVDVMSLSPPSPPPPEAGQSHGNERSNERLGWRQDEWFVRNSFSGGGAKGPERYSLTLKVEQ